MSATTWTGWIKLFGRWLRLTAGHDTMSMARRAVDAEIERRRICVHPRWLRIVASEQRPRDE
ncbi:MAG TPA: hypothetical protein VN692_09700 [Steroidobacteraceae bacterium]|nr:hypothetical protein [Steroidobacteraceae bacterium]